MRSFALSLPAFLLAAGAALAAEPSFGRDVAPILQRHCVFCHRPGEIAPMSLLLYAQVRPYAKAIRDELVAGTMPPWPADPRYGRFANDRRLPDAERALLLRWIAAGAPEGEKVPLLRAPPSPGGWHIGTPDAVVALPERVRVPARGDLPNQYFTVESGFTEDRWVSALEIRPDRREVVHHITVFFELAGDRRLRKPPAIPCTDRPFEEGALRQQRTQPDATSTSPRQYLYSWTPGSTPFSAATGQARRIPAGSLLVFEVHYAPNGTATSDQSALGFVFAKAPVTNEVTTLVATNEAIGIPPGEPNYEARACLFLVRDVTLYALKPHMHLRGHDIRFDVEPEGGGRETLLFVPRWDFDWQLTYELAAPRVLPAGTRIHLVAHYDNSAKNRRNPDPTRFVAWDNQSTGEMLAGMITVAEPRR